MTGKGLYKRMESREDEDEKKEKKEWRKERERPQPLIKSRSAPTHLLGLDIQWT